VLVTPAPDFVVFDGADALRAMLEYDPANDTLTDDSGVVWERAS
jgi:hypothetical protein